MRLNIIQEVEWRKCKRDPVHFIENYWHIKIPGKEGLQLMELMPYQVEEIRNFESERYSLILKARQIGFTTLAAAYVGWYALFRPQVRCVIISRNREHAANTLKILKDTGLELLPPFMKSRVSIENRSQQSIQFSNGSSIESHQSQRDAARGLSLDLLVMDEWAFMKDLEEVWAAAGASVSVGGSCIAMSTAKMGAVEFQRQWDLALSGKNGWSPRFYGWQSRPERDEVWYSQTSEQFTADYRMKSEHPGSPEEAFQESGQGAFSQEALMMLGHEPGVSVSLSKAAQGVRSSRHASGPVSIFSFPPHIRGTPDPDVALGVPDPLSPRFVIGADPTGVNTSGDYASATVLDEGGTVVATLSVQLPPDEFADYLILLSIFYNEALIGIETTGGHGDWCIHHILDRGYNRLFYDRHRKDVSGRYKPGIHTTKGAKQMWVTALDTALRGGDIYVPCAETRKEMKNYMVLGHTSQGGYKYGGRPHDDRVMSLLFAHSILPHIGQRMHEPDPQDLPYGSIAWVNSMIEQQLSLREMRGQPKEYYTAAEIMAQRSAT